MTSCLHSGGTIEVEDTEMKWAFMIMMVTSGISLYIAGESHDQIQIGFSKVVFVLCAIGYEIARRPE